jgi:hypothetical protein
MQGVITRNKISDDTKKGVEMRKKRINANIYVITRNERRFTQIKRGITRIKTS